MYLPGRTLTKYKKIQSGKSVLQSCILNLLLISAVVLNVTPYSLAHYVTCYIMML